MKIIKAFIVIFKGHNGWQGDDLYKLVKSIHTLIDGAYGVYNNVRSQTGGEFSLGWGLNT